MTPPPASTAAARLAADRRVAASPPVPAPAGRVRAGSVSQATRPAVVRTTPPGASSDTSVRRTRTALTRTVAPAGQTIATAVSSAARSTGEILSRRISGPAGSASAARVIASESIPARIPAGEPLSRRLALVVRHAPDLAITHRVARGRLWIALLAAGLIGIVFLQVSLLGMNSGIGRDLSAVTKLQRQNAELKSEVSGLASETRIVAEAQRMGFVEPPVGSSRFVSPSQGDAARGVAAMRAPSGGPAAPQYERAASTRLTNPSANQVSGQQASPVNDPALGQVSTQASNQVATTSQPVVGYTPADG